MIVLYHPSYGTGAVPYGTVLYRTHTTSIYCSVKRRTALRTSSMLAQLNRRRNGLFGMRIEAS
jgi:hypothetical protein